jgi:ribose transport system substrate-binding protein
MTRRTSLIASLAVVAALAPAAALGQSPAASGGALTDGSGITIGFSQANNGDVWRGHQTNVVEQTCKALMPNSTVIVTDGQGDATKQSADVDDLLAQGIDILLLTPLEAEQLTPAAQRALDAGVPVITLDRQVTIPVTQHIGADNKLIGQAAAEYVANTILGGQGGKVLEIQGVLGASATTDRHDEFVNWLTANAPNVEIVGGSQTGEYRRENALTVMNDYLQAFPNAGDVQVVYTHNDEMALGAIQALETAGRQDEMQVVGIDGVQNEAFQAIKDGRLVVTFTYSNASAEACQSAQQLLSGQTLPDTWVLDTQTIDASNVDEFMGTGF